MTLICIIYPLIEFKFTFILTINCVICQMHVHVIQVFLWWLLVRFSRESRHTFFKQINLQRLHREQKNVQTAIKFEIIDQHRIFDILLDYVMILTIQILKPICKKDAATLTSGLRLDDVHWPICSLLFEESWLKLTEFRRQEVRSWKKLVFLFEFLLHFYQIARQRILSGKLKHARKVIASLIRLHSGNALRQYAAIGPIDVPVIIFVVLQAIVPTISSLNFPIFER